MNPAVRQAQSRRRLRTRPLLALDFWHETSSASMPRGAGSSLTAALKPFDIFLVAVHDFRSKQPLLPAGAESGWLGHVLYDFLEQSWPFVD
jgi:hypothetical protein